MHRQKRSSKKPASSGFVIGRSSFAKISAVEGLKLTPAMKKRADVSKSKKLSSEEARKAIVQSYRKG